MKRRLATILGAALSATGAGATEAPVFVPPELPPCERTQPPEAPEFESLDLSDHWWYARHLAAANEAPLRTTKDPSAESYRFTLLPSFHNPEILRLDRRGETYTITAKRLDGKGGYEPGKLVLNTTTQINSEQWERIVQLLSDASYWSLTTKKALDEYHWEVSKANCDSTIGYGTDGTTLIVEGATSTRWHAIDRWGPPQWLVAVWRQLESLANN